jgi:benzoate-CoA ligase
VDDQGTLSYGELATRVRQVAAGLLALGLRREERVLLLMQDGTDWPVSFLGAMYAGLVPVAVNTLLTADDYAYMLEHSRAQAALVSGALLPALTSAMVKSDHEVKKVIVSRPAAPLHPSEVEMEAFLQAQQPLAKPQQQRPTTPASGCIHRGPPVAPRAPCIHMATPYWTAELYGKGVLALTENDVCFSAAKLFFAYGLGNAITFPMAVGATTILMAERPTPEATFARWLGKVGGAKPTVFYGAPTGFAGMLAHPALPAKTDVALRLVSSAGEALPAELGERFKAHFGVDIVDGIGSTEMLHIFLSNKPDQVRYGTTGWPVPGYEIELRGDDGKPLPLNADGSSEPGDLYIHGPSAAMMYWGQPPENARHLPGRLDQKRRQIHPQRRRHLHLRRPQRRHAEGQRHLRQPIRGGGHTGATQRGAGGRRHRRERCRRPDQNQGLRGAEKRPHRHRGRAEGIRERQAGTVQVPAPDRVR